MGRQGPTRFGDDVGHRMPRGPRDRSQHIDHVVGILPRRVVHAGVPRGAGSVVVHPQAPAHIHMGQFESEVPDFRIVAADLLQAGAHHPDVGDLAAQVEVDQLEQVLQPVRGQAIEEAHELDGPESELGCLPAALGPSSGALGGELDADAEGRDHPHLSRHGQNRVEFRHRLEHDEHTMTQALSHEGQSHELLVLVSIAHNHMIGALSQPQNGLQLRLAPALQTHPKGTAILHDLLDHMPLLVDLDRIDRGIAAGVPELLHGPLEIRGQGRDARLQDVGEPEQQGQPHALRAQVHGQLEDVEFLRVRGIGTHDNVTLRIDAEVSETPPGHVVEPLRVPGGPCRTGDQNLLEQVGVEAVNCNGRAGERNRNMPMPSRGRPLYWET